MDRTERIGFARCLLERVELDRHAPVVGGHVAARWASGAFAHALMAHTGDPDISAESPASMYAAALRLDRDDGGGERWRQIAFAAYELSRHFCFGDLSADELERKVAEAVGGTAELLDRLDPGGAEAGTRHAEEMAQAYEEEAL